MKNQNEPTKPYFAIRPGNDDVREYTKDGHKLLAVAGSHPYGDLTHTGTRGLLKEAETATDYTIYEVPSAAMALKAMSLGTGKLHVELLQSTYRRVGKAVGRIASEGIRAPELSIDDIAVNRRTGAVYVLPPVAFITEKCSDKDGFATFTDSISTLHSVFDQADIHILQECLQDGLAS
jgi:hypothetical protein